MTQVSPPEPAGSTPLTLDVAQTTTTEADPTIDAARRGDRSACALLLRGLQDPWYRVCLGLLGGDACGFPNGRRLQDDVTDIELLAVAGAAYSVLTNDTFNFNPALIDVLRQCRRPRTPAGFSIGVTAMQATKERLRHIMNDSTRSHARTPWSAWAALLVGAIVLLPGAGIAIGQQQSKPPRDQANAGPDAKPQAAAEEAMTFSGNVFDRSTGKPIEGATIVVRRLKTVATGMAKAAESTEHKTDAAGRFEFTSSVEMVLPPRIRNEAFVQSLVHPYAAQIMDLVGGAAPRPAAPWGYTNTWGHNFCLLVGWFLVAVRGRPASHGAGLRGRRERRAGGEPEEFLAVIPYVARSAEGFGGRRGVDRLDVVARSAGHGYAPL